jgi:hypothetical protein
MSQFEILTRAQIHALVAPLVGTELIPDGFEEIDTLKWVRSTDAPIRQVFQFSQWKGGSLAPTWALSLDFVPSVSAAKKVKWHRTAKSAKLDLVINPRDLDMAYHTGVQPIRSRAPEVVSNAVARARQFWDRSRRTSDLPQEFDRLRADLGRMFNNYGNHHLAFAFVLSATGRLVDANRELDDFVRRWEVGDEVAAKLRSLVMSAHVA